MRRHDRASTREAATRYKRRRLRLWTGRWGVPEETAVRFLRDRKRCSCPWCKRGQVVAHRRDAEAERDEMAEAQP